jgi:FdhE protein
MHRTAGGLRTDPAARLAELERQSPEWRAWLRLLSEVGGALEDPAWARPLGDGEPVGAAVGPRGAPLLHGRTLEVDTGRWRRLLRRLAARAAGDAAGGEAAGATSLRGYRLRAADAMELLRATVGADRNETGALAARHGVDPAALATVAELALLPLLHACGRLLQPEVPRSWPHGYCPICAAWPVLAERRGLDQTRHLRCGRCGGDWQGQWLWCIYCGEKVHERLGSLVSEERGDRLTVDTCAHCGGYLKSITTLQPIAPFELLLQDAETVELDLVALDRGYSRPAGTGFALDVRIAARPSGIVGRLRRG